MDETTWLKVLGGGAVTAVLFYGLNLLLSRKVRTSGEFDDLAKRHAEQVAELKAEIKFWRDRSDTFETKAHEVKARLDSMRGVAREAVNELEKNGQ